MEHEINERDSTVKEIKEMGEKYNLNDKGIIAVLFKEFIDELKDIKKLLKRRL